MIKILRGVRLDIVEAFTFNPDSIYIQKNSSYESLMNFDPTIRKALTLGPSTVFEVASDVDSLIDKVGQDLPSYLMSIVDNRPRDFITWGPPYYGDLFIFADKHSFIPLLVKVWKTVLKSATVEDLWWLYNVYRMYCEYGRQTKTWHKDNYIPDYFSYTKDTFTALCDSTQPLKTRKGAFEIAPPEFQMASILLNKDHPKKDIFLKDMKNMLRTFVAISLGMMKMELDRRTYELHNFYPEHFNSKKAYDCSEDEIREVITKIFDGDGSFFYEQGMYESLDRELLTDLETKHNMVRIGEILLDFEWRLWKLELSEKLTANKEDLIYSPMGFLHLYVKDRGNIDVLSFIEEDIKKQRITTIHSNLSGRYGMNSLLLTMIREKHNDPEFLKKISLE